MKPLALCALLLPLPARAGQPAASLHVHVRESSGAALQASAELTGPVRRKLQTDPAGDFSFTALPPGRYRLTVARAGFTPQTLALTLTATLDGTPPAERTVLLAVAAAAASITVAATPTGSTGVPARDIPAPIQTVSADQIEAVHALDLADALNKRVNGVYINENAGNPFEVDVNYRGYTASPLLGTPQGLSVYLDGVRQNQPFGDIVAWDLIPKAAIREVVLIPGSDPLYGLNTLGGALALHTKDGASDPGLEVETVGGSFGRASVEGTWGGSDGRKLDWFAAGNDYREDGWRQASPSRVRQSFAKLRRSTARSSTALSAAYSINSLAGNGLQDFRALARSYASVYTTPDATFDHAPSLTLESTHALSPAWSLSGSAYLRHIRSDTVNGNLNNDAFGQDLLTLGPSDAAALTAAGYPLTDTSQYPSLLCIAQALESADPSATCDGLTTDTVTQQNNYGLTGLASSHRARNSFSLGGSWDRSSLSYGQLAQFGYLAADGVSIARVPAFADGSTQDGGVPVDTRVQLHGTVQTASAYATDTWTPSGASGHWALTASARYNHTALRNFDRLPVSSVRGSLTADNSWQRLNPAVGAVYHARPSLDLYGGYSESSRAPTSIELGCADPNFPCNLPNALVADPPLAQVVARTVEAGVRGSHAEAVRWSAGWFRTENTDDLLFVSSGQLGFGYFLNFGRTRREGLELQARAHTRVLLFDGGYTFLSATYQSPQTLGGTANSTDSAGPGQDGTIAIIPGDRIPQTPRHLVKGLVEWRPTPRLGADLNVLLASSSYARGNENNRDRPDGVFSLGPGTSAPYGVANLGAHYQLSPRFSLFLQGNNVLDRHYSTGSQLAVTPFDNAGRFNPSPFPPAADGSAPLRGTTFQAPGAPFNLFGGLRVHLR